MRFTLVILSAVLCLNAGAESDIDARSDDAIIAAAEQLIAEAEAEKKQETEAIPELKVATDAGKSQIDGRKESEIPVFMTTAKSEKSDSNILWRLVASIGLIVVVAAGFVYAGKRWTRHKDKGGRKARIEIMHQLHLGPRRSVALLRISGETMLVGITDHSVNMLKSVTLIDDELEDIATKDFNGFLEEEFSIEDVRIALGPR